MEQIKLTQHDGDVLSVTMLDGLDAGNILDARTDSPRFDLLTDELTSDELTGILDVFNAWRFDAGLSVVGQMSDADGEAIV